MRVLRDASELHRQGVRQPHVSIGAVDPHRIVWSHSINCSNGNDMMTGDSDCLCFGLQRIFSPNFSMDRNQIHLCMYVQRNCEAYQQQNTLDPECPDGASDSSLCYLADCCNNEDGHGTDRGRDTK